MKTTLTRLYDDYTTPFLALLVLAGALAGAAIAYDPSMQPEATPAAATPTPALPAATPASIVVNIPSPMPAATADPEFGTLIAPGNFLLFRDDSGFSAPPLLGEDGSIYIASDGGSLYAFDGSGALRWEIELPAPPAGNLALSPTGEILAADRSGRLAAYAADGSLAWAFQPEDGSGAVSGPLVIPDGRMAYMLETGGAGFMQAVEPGGSPAWRSPVGGLSFRITPWFYPPGDLVFLKSEAFDAQTGAPVPVELPFPVDDWITAADGSAFLQSGPTIAAWTLVDGVVTLPEDGLRFVIPDSGASIRQASIDPAGTSWISYIGQTTDGVAWYQQDGSLASQVVIGNMLLSVIIAEDESGTLYGCGPSPRQVSAEQLSQRSTYCVALVPGEERPRWQERFAASAQFFAGSVRMGNVVFIATEEGELVLMGRAEQAVTEAPEAETGDGVTQLPNGWHWRAPARVVNYPEVYPDGSLALLMETGEIVFFGADGSLLGKAAFPLFKMPDDFYSLPVFFYPDQTVVAVTSSLAFAIQPGNGLQWEFPVTYIAEAENAYLQRYESGDLSFLLDTVRTLHAFRPAEGLLWSYPLEAGVRDDFGSAATDGSGRLYIVDRDGRLHAFDASGLAWSYHPGGNLRSASDPRLGPDGRIYYVTTSGSTGYLESVNPDGTVRWHTELETFRFYTPPSFSGSGSYVRVSEDFIDSAGGALLSIEFPFEVEAFIEGEDGNNYLLAGNHIIRWQIGPNGYEETRHYTVNLGDQNSFFSPNVRVYPGGEIEYQGFTPQNILQFWIDPVTGNVRSFERPWSQIVFTTGSEGPELVTCTQDLEALILDCNKEVPGSPEPVWSLAIQGIDGNVAGFPPSIRYQDGLLYIVAGGVNVYVLEVEIP